MSKKLISEAYSAAELIKNKELAEKVVSPISVADAKYPVKLLKIAKREFPSFENNVELILKFRGESRQSAHTIFGFVDGSDGDPYYEMKLKRPVSKKLVDDFYENIDRVVSNVPPLDNKWFELTVDHSIIKPRDIIKLCHEDPDILEYIGPDFEDKKVYRVKLIRLDDYYSVRKLKAVVSRMGYRFIECQAVKSFVEKFPFPYPSGNCQIFFGGSEFEDNWGKSFVTRLGIRNKKWDFSLKFSQYIDRDTQNCWLVESIK